MIFLRSLNIRPGLFDEHISLNIQNKTHKCENMAKITNFHPFFSWPRRLKFSCDD